MIGPKITIHKSCFNCDVCECEPEATKPYIVYCDHEKFPKKRPIGDRTWTTPNWCPELANEMILPFTLKTN